MVLISRFVRKSGWLLVVLGVIVGGWSIAKISKLVMADTYDFAHPAEVSRIGDEGNYHLFAVNHIQSDHVGNIYATSWSGRVSKYDTGTGIWTVLADGGGTGVGQFDSPSGIDVNSSGNIYVADNNSKPIQKYDVGTSSWIRFNKYISDVSGLSVDSVGNIYVLDSDGVLQKYSVGTSSWSVLGSGGTAVGQFDAPSGIDVDDSGNIYVADTGNDRIQKYNIMTTSWSVLATGGTGVGQFDAPRGIDVDDSGNIYVADGGNRRIQKYDKETDNWSIFWSGYGVSDLSLDGQGSIYMLGDYGKVLYKGNLNTGVFSIVGKSYFDNDDGLAPLSVVVDSVGNIYTTNLTDYFYNGLSYHRVRKYDVGSSKWIGLDIGGTGSELGQFDAPSGIDVDDSGNIYVADTGNDRIQKYNIMTTSWSVLATGGTGVGQFDAPRGIDVDDSGNIYVADGGNRRIQKYDIGTGNWTSLGYYGSNYHYPRGINVDPFGNIYSSGDACDVYKYKSSNNTWISVGSFTCSAYGSGDANGISTDSSGNIYMADTLNSSIKKYNVGTSSWSTIITYGTESQKVRFPGDIDVDSNNNIYIADTYNGRIQKYDVGISGWVIYGGYTSSGLGSFGKNIGDLSFDSSGNMYAVDTNNGRIQKYDVGTSSWSAYGGKSAMLLDIDSEGLSGLASVAVDGFGNMYLGHIGGGNQGAISKYNVGTSSWSFLGEFDNTQSIIPGGLDTASSLLISDNNLYVADSFDNGIQKYNIGTSTWTVIGSGGTGVGQFNGLGDMVMFNGDLYVSDAWNYRVQKYNIGTTTWSVVASIGSGAMAIDSVGNIYSVSSDSLRKYDIGTTTWLSYKNYNFGQLNTVEVDNDDNVYVADLNGSIWKLTYNSDVLQTESPSPTPTSEPSPTPTIELTPSPSPSPSPSPTESPTPSSYVLTYSRQPNGSILGQSPQTVASGGNGTKVLAVGDSGYTFLQWNDGSLDNPRMDVGVTGDISVSAEFTLARSFSSGIGLTMANEVSEGNISIGSSELTDTVSFTFNTAYAFEDNSAIAAIPANTVVTRSDSGSLNLNTFEVLNVTLQALAEKTGILGALKVGVPDYGLSFSKNISLIIPVSTSFNGQTLKVWSRTEGSTTWNEETTCLVVNGKCAFQTNHATTFAVIQDVVVSSNTQQTSSSNNSSLAGPPGPPVCTDSQPLFAPDLFQVNASKNSAKLYFTPLNDTNGRYYISFSAVNSNAEEHGEIVTLLKEGVQSHTIYKLKPNTTYYVKVRGQNGCMPGKWSTIMKFKTGSSLKRFYKYTAVKKVIKSIFGR